MSLAALAAYSDSDDSGGEEEQQDNNGKTSSKTSRQDIRNLVTIVGGRKDKTGPVRIGLPVLKDKLQDQSDISAPVPKKHKGGCGLTALLPEPKRGFSVKPVNPSPSSKPVFASMLVPDTLRVQRVQRKRTAGHQHGRDGGSSRSEPKGEESEGSGDEDTPFFSHLKTTETPVVSAGSGSSTSVSSSDVNTVNSHKTSDTHSMLPQRPTGVSTGYTPTTAPEQINIAPSQSDPAPPPIQPSAAPSAAPTAPCHGTGWGSGNTGVPGSSSSYTYSTSAGTTTDNTPLDETSLRRLAGGKRGQKKREEEISLQQIVDIHEQDNLVKDRDKYLTQEHSYTSGTMPAHLVCDYNQKRKHQMIWLANQAKTRELELKNFWAQSAHSRRQTQSKYGF